MKERFEVEDIEKRKRCCEKIFSINNEDGLKRQIQEILKGTINAKWEETAKHQLKDKILRMGYARQRQSYWHFMRNIFKQVILHNIWKANRIQNLVDWTENDGDREKFERIDLGEILNIQNMSSKDSESGFIWVLCTCVFFIAEYNFNLVLDV